MTTVAMVAGMVPTALSLTGDAAWRAPMGVVVIGGLLLSTVLTLVIVPATFSLGARHRGAARPAAAALVHHRRPAGQATRTTSRRNNRRAV